MRTLPYLFNKSTFDAKLSNTILSEKESTWLKHRCLIKQTELQARRLAKNMRPLITDADYFCANLECPISFKGEPIAAKRYTLRADPYTTWILRYLGISHIGMANNHILDFGPEALADTLRFLNSAGIEYLGLCNQDSVSEASIIKDRDSEIAIIGYVEKSIITPDPDLFFRHDPSPCPLEIDATVNDIKILANNRAVIVYLHWGIEWSHRETGYQRDLAHKFIDAGATAVIGHHSHLMGTIEEYKNGLIVYGLGNLYMILPPFAFFKSAKRAVVKLELIQNQLVSYDLIPLDYDDNRRPIPGDFNTRSLNNDHYPDCFPAREAVIFDSYVSLKFAKANLNHNEESGQCHWSDDFLVRENIPLYRLPMGPGWRAADGSWAGMALGREFLKDEFINVKIAHLSAGQTLSLKYQLDKPVSKLVSLCCYPEAMSLLREFRCASLIIKADGAVIAEINPDQLSTAHTVIENFNLNQPVNSLEIIVRADNEKYSLMGCRLFGI
jgi:hypothetical protein